MSGRFEGTRRELERAIRRLSALEFLFLGAAVLVAFVAGALVAYLLHTLAGFTFFTSWIALSFLFLVVPALLAAGREWRSRRRTEGGRGKGPGEGP